VEESGVLKTVVAVLESREVRGWRVGTEAGGRWMSESKQTRGIENAQSNPRLTAVCVREGG
jgi:hypothetical protein